jgi:autotransporter-associated beta strand protein
MLWHQGEADYGEAHDYYQSLLTNFIASVRSTFGLPNLPFVIGEINQVNPVPGYLIIRQAQYDSSQIVPNGYFVTSMNLPVQSDGLHFLSTAVLGLGQRFGSQACAFMSSAAATQTWALAGGGTWSTNAVAWTTNGGTTTTAWNNSGNAAVFGPAGSNPAVTLSGALNAYSLTIASNAIGYTFSGGTLTIGNGGIAADQSATIGSFLITGGIQIQSVVTAQTLTVTGPLNLSIHTVDITGDGMTTLSGLISDVGNDPTNSLFLYDSALIQKLGNGTLTVLNSNVFTGGILIRSGAVQIGDGVATNGFVPGNIEDYSTLTFANPTAQSYAGVISGTGTVVKVGAGQLSLIGSNGYSGGTVINGGTISVSADINLGSGGYYYSGDGYLALNNGAMLQVTGTNDSSFGRPIVLGAGGGGFDINAASNNLTVSSPISGSGGFIKAGLGTLTIANALTYTGTTSIRSGAVDLASSPLNGPVYVAAGASLNMGPLPGLMGQYYNIMPSDVNTTDPDFASLTNLEYVLAGQTPGLWSLSSTAGANFDFSGTGSGFPSPYNTNAYNFEALWAGTFNAPTNGTYTFDTASDDGSMLWIDGTNVVNNNAFQGLTTVSGTISMAAGLHAITVGYYQGNNTWGFYADMAQPGGSLQRLPNALLQYGATAYAIGSLSGDPGSAVNLASYQLTVNQTSNGTFAGNLTSTSGGLVKTGPANLTLSGSNSLGNATTVDQGTLTLDYTSQNNSKISSSGPLVLGGGTLQVLGNLTGSFTQQVSGLSLQGNNASTIINESGNTLLDFTTGNVVGLGGNYSVNFFVTGGGGVRLPETPNSLLGIWAATDSGDPAYVNANLFVVPLPSYAGALPAAGANPAGNYLDTVGIVTNSETASLLNFRDAPALVISNGVVLQLSSGLLFPGLTALGIAGNGQLGASNAGLVINTSASLGTNALTIGAFISGGSGSLTKLGPGTLIVTNNNTFTGGTTIASGVLQIGTGGSLGPGNIQDNGTLVYAHADAVTLTNTITGNGTLVQAGTNLLSVAVNEQQSVTVVDAGTLSLNVSQSSTGGTIVAGGYLLLNAPAQNPTLARYSSITVNAGGQVGVTNINNVQNDESWTINGGGVSIIGGGHQHFGSLIFNNGGSITTGPGSMAYDGRGNYSLDSNVTIAGSAPATLDANTGINLGALLVGNSNVTFAVAHVTGNGNADLTVTTKLTNHDGDGSPRGLIKTGSGTMLLSAACDFSGGATISNGVLMLGNILAAQNSTVNNLANGGLAFTGTNVFIIGGLAGNGSIGLTNGSGPITLGVGNNGNNTVYAGSLTGNGGLTKINSGVLTLTGLNSYTGVTVVNGGTLALSGAGQLANSSLITVSNATLDVTGVTAGNMTLSSGQTLQGAGAVNGTLTIAAGATLSPGLPTGTLTFSRPLVIGNGATLQFALGTNSALAAVTGNLTLGGTLNVTDAGGFTNTNYTLFTYTGTLTYNGVAISSRPNWGMTYTMDTNTHGQVKLDVTSGSTLSSYQQWQFQYFNCTNCTAAATNTDWDGTGQNNLFKFTAGLNPTNPASIFVVHIAGVTNPPGQKIVSYTPITTGRTYTVQFSANMVGAAYTNLTAFTGPVTNGSATQASVTDTNATQSAKFYRVQISMP